MTSRWVFLDVHRKVPVIGRSAMVQRKGASSVRSNRRCTGLRTLMGSGGVERHDKEEEGVGETLC